MTTLYILKIFYCFIIISNDESLIVRNANNRSQFCPSHKIPFFQGGKVSPLIMINIMCMIELINFHLKTL